MLLTAYLIVAIFTAGIVARMSWEFQHDPNTDPWEIWAAMLVLPLVFGIGWPILLAFHVWIWWAERQTA